MLPVRKISSAPDTNQVINIYSDEAMNKHVQFDNLTSLKLHYSKYKFIQLTYIWNALVTVNKMSNMKLF